MKKAGRNNRPQRSYHAEDFRIPERRSAWRDYAPVAFGGVMLVLSFAFAGHYMGKNAVAHNAVPEESLASIAAPTTNIVAKGSLLPEGTTMEIVNISTIPKNDNVVEIGKTDMPLTKIAAKPKAKPAEIALKIVPAAVNLKEEAETTTVAALSPPKTKVEQAFKLKRTEKKKATAQRRVQLAEENCLARGIYFEARSESEMGQLAVAKVILNRVKDPNYPNTICGVVYQGSGRRNSCQFSFACDGLPDDVRSPAAWANAKRVAQKAIAGDSRLASVNSATNYHADYVKPRWAKSMKRLVKIGRHIFYSDT